MNCFKINDLGKKDSLLPLLAPLKAFIPIYEDEAFEGATLLFHLLLDH